MNFRFESNLIQNNVSASNKEEAIQLIAEPLIEQGFVSSKYPDLVKEREVSYPTGLSTFYESIAIPHAFDSSVRGNHIAIGVLNQPVAFKNMEDPENSIDVKIVFLLAINNSSEHLEMLKVLMKIFKQNVLIHSILESNSSEKISNTLNNYIRSL